MLILSRWQQRVVPAGRPNAFGDRDEVLRGRISLGTIVERLRRVPRRSFKLHAVLIALALLFVERHVFTRTGGWRHHGALTDLQGSRSPVRESRQSASQNGTRVDATSNDEG